MHLKNNSSLKAQISIEAIILFTITIAIIATFALTYTEIIQTTHSFMSKKYLDYYKKKIENVCDVVCELGKGSALKIELGHAKIQNNKIIVGKEAKIINSKCQIETNDEEIKNSVWIIKASDDSIHFVSGTPLN